MIINYGTISVGYFIVYI